MRLKRIVNLGSSFVARPWVHGLAAAAGLVALGEALGPSSYLGFLVTVAVLYAIAALGLNIPAGMLGQLSLGQGGLFAVGAYGAATLSVDRGWPIAATLPAAAIAGFVIGAILGLPAARLGSLGIGMVSLGFTLVVTDLALALDALTGGPSGRFGIYAPFLPGQPPLKQNSLFLVVVVAGLAAYLVHWWFRTSSIGRASLALRSNELGATALGVSPPTVKIIGVAVGSSIGAVAGSLYAYVTTAVSPDAFGIGLSVLLLLMVLLGGPGTRTGPVVGAALLSTIPILLASYPGTNAYVYGLALILVVRWLPRGIVSRTGVLIANSVLDFRQRSSVWTPKRPILEQQRDKHAPLLEVQGITRTFRGVRAVANVSFDVSSGEIFALVGPNGSGKTTVLNLISQFYPLTAGEIRLGGQRVTGSPNKVSRLGVGRTFQVPKLFPELTVGEHLALALRYQRANQASVTEFVLSFLDAVGLGSRLGQEVRVLGHGQRRFLEVSLAVIRSPALLLMDEPAAGLSASEMDTLISLIANLAGIGLGIVLVEHHLDMVKTVASRVGVMNVGALIWAGSPTDLEQREEVREAYLGPGVLGEA